MFEMSLGADGANYSVQRAEERFEQHRQEIFRRTDRLFARLMPFQWLAAIVIALTVLPRTWNAQSNQVHAHVWVAIFFGGAISVIPIWLTRFRPGAAVTRNVIAVAQMLMSALLIALTGGRIETHFHVFGSLVLLSFYRDWRVLIPATIVVALDHFLSGIYCPYFVYGAVATSPALLALEHLSWVIFEDVFLVISCLYSIREMRSIANWTAALEASEQRFRHFFDEAPIGMAVVGLDESFKQVNKTLCHMVGYSESELTKRTTVDITFEDDIEQGKQNAEELLTGGSRSSVERRYVRKDGEILWITRTACLMRDVDGCPRNFLVMVEDICERKRAEELCESKRELESAHYASQLAMDNSQDVICTIDEAGRFATVNAACEQMWGYTPAELLGRQTVELVYPEDRAMTQQVRDVLRLDGKITDFVNRFVRKDGMLVDVLRSASWSASDKTTYCVAHDVTDRAKIEKQLREAKQEAERANHAKSEFLSRMSHELRTPLNAILGFGQLLERQQHTEIQRPRINHIISAGRHLLKLINEVLDISRVDTGNLPLSLEPVCLEEALEEVLSLMRPLAAERGTELVTPEKSEEARYVMADRQRLKQVLLNLLTNAIKYTPLDGKVTVEFNVKGDAVRIMVSDTGAGISSEKLSRLFTPFDRLGAEQSGVEGTGLGLALCQRLVQAMNGSIGVNSREGHGSTFWVELSRAECPFQRLVLPDPDGARPLKESDEERRTILYIEDNLSNLTLVDQILADQPHIKLITAMQGQLGLELARQHSPDLVLLDLHLPDLHGRDVLSRLRSDEATCEIPVVIISADATSRQVKLMAAGAYGYLTKPLDIPEFLRVINEAFALGVTNDSVAA